MVAALDQVTFCSSYCATSLYIKKLMVAALDQVTFSFSLTLCFYMNALSFKRMNQLDFFYI